jgi:hypothetical protein
MVPKSEFFLMGSASLGFPKNLVRKETNPELSFAPVSQFLVYNIKALNEDICKRPELKISRINQVIEVSTNI